MGFGRWDSDEWSGYAATVASKPVDEIFTSTSIKNDLDPTAIKVRESRDSDKNPESTPIILALDVTGSMGILAENMVKKGLGVLIEEILERKPVSDPHIMLMGVGDAKCDTSPLQVTQFEADNCIAKQLENIYLEGGGGGNHTESYSLPWYFAATRTQLDCVEKGRRKGLIFTIGDEEAPETILAEQLRRFLDEKEASDVTPAEALEMVRRKYDVFHVVVLEGNYASQSRSSVVKSWNKLLGQQNVILLPDHTKLAEVVVSAIQVHEGESKDKVAKSWDGSTNMVVASALKDLVARAANGNGKGLATVDPAVVRRKTARARGSR